ncbi:uncharacterized protein LOC100905565 [Galendromus occidentalis]|uniref:Uncharacterized protein LOC100905565 n=1 Tax=Galendromus occidentalis TaxID=34638 RepID=A0AAJ6QQ94_9ACAR|nr:uncharacterized protein LOC100905565 [Galendromus occidentalis]
MAAPEFFLAVTLFCVALSFAEGTEGPNELEAKVTPTGNGFVSITFSWDEGSCATNSTEYSLLFEGSKTPLITKDLRYEVHDLQFWTYYSVSLRASEPCPPTWLSRTEYTGQGEPHRVKKFTAIPDGEALQLIVEEAFMPKTVTSYVVNISDSSKEESLVVDRKRSDVKHEVWRTKLRKRLVPGNLYRISIAPQIEDGSERYVGDQLVVTAKAYASPSKLTALVLMNSLNASGKVDVEMKWQLEDIDPDFKYFDVTWRKTDDQKPIGNARTHWNKFYLDQLDIRSSYTVEVAAVYRPHEHDSFVRSASINFDTIGKLLPPANLQVAHLSANEVLLGWSAVLPSDSGIQVSDLKFNVEYLAPNKIKESVIVNTTQAILRGLDKSTNYTTTVTAILENWIDAEGSSMQFETRTEDWPAATIVKASVLSEGIEDRAVYDFGWDLPERECLERFEVIICDTNCTTIPKWLGEEHQEFILDYDVDFNVTVKTIYDQPLGQSIMRLSQTFKSRSTVGRPDSVDFIAIKQELRWLSLEWKPPQKTRGPVDHYHIKIWDASNPLLVNSANSSDLRALISLPHLAGSSYKVTLSAVSVDTLTRQEFLSEVVNENLREIEFLPPPARLETIKRKGHSIKLRAVPSSILSPIFYKFRWSANDKEFGVVASNEHEINKLAPYERVEYNVSACFLDSAEEPLCGEPISSSDMTNVESPLAVSNFSVVVNENNSLALTWDEPSVKNGPLDGYIVRIYQPSLQASTQRNYSLNPADSEYLITATDDSTAYDVTIAAYNLDLDTHEIVMGEISLKSLHTRGGVEAAGWIIPAAFLTLIAAVGVAVIGFHVRKKRSSRRKGPILSFSLLDDGLDR